MQNRGGSEDSVQEMAARLFEQQLHDEIVKGGYKDFWEYKDGMHNGEFVRDTPLVIHEDYDGKSFLLVPKYLHDNWSHYGGIALVRAVVENGAIAPVKVVVENGAIAPVKVVVENGAIAPVKVVENNSIV